MSSNLAPFRQPLPANPATLSFLLLLAGFALASAFLIYEVTQTKYSRSLVRELSLAVPASALLGMGILVSFVNNGVAL
ncbi:hypothetical protein M427DRAFT_53179 [Gonapodya prolifera JEL478]|uniref:Dolichyl-diphosphooligosaccharide-protein glycosyltransferase subunit OST5 n=1 Tax=Gonapodya prolifera (strain JEL478) TaxID=1344416 RepID=A0A139ARQ5_GONPJ|nr:hypothetical protein M427DRAFT_53179 [Gonapodya prolifera JEL478]|eukprot:KXS19223.1 hypothetical protein M427DRAFT_53179 [Gonapodya prolifera JEL478]